MADCSINPDTLTCTVCGASVPSADTRRNCTPGLGDKVAAVLSARGITEELVSRLLGRDCGCKQRREALNRWSRAREAEDV